MIAEELQVAGVVRRDAASPETAGGTTPREPAPGGRSAVGTRSTSSIGREAATRHDHVHMRVVGERGAPGVQHRQEADASAEVLGVGCDGDQRLGRGLEQQIVDHGLVLVGDVGDGRRQREHHVKVRHRQQLGFALGEPLPRSRPLALRAVPVAAGVVGDEGVRALLAARNMPAEGRRAAALDR